MFMTKLKLATAALSALCVITSPLRAQEKPPAPRAGLSLAEFEKLHKDLQIKSQPWAAIPWLASITEARQLAAKEKKPILLFTGNGSLICGG